MREPTLIRGGRLVRPEGMSHDEWGAALARHRRARRWTRARALIDDTYSMMHALLGDPDDIDDRRIEGLRNVVHAAMHSARYSRFAQTPEVAEPVKKIEDRLQAYTRKQPEDPHVRYARLHALHDPIVDIANRVLELADLLGEHRLWALSETRTVLLEARLVAQMARDRWAGFPMSNDLRDALARLQGEIDKLDPASYDADAIAAIDFSGDT